MIDRIKLEIDTDGLSAFITVSPGRAEAPERLREALAETGIVHGVDDALCDVVASSLKDERFRIDRRLIAEGTPPQPGKPQRIEPRFEVGIQGSAERKDGTTDFHNRGLIKPAASGQVIATMVPETPPVPGVTVKGTPLQPAASQDEKLAKLGDGVAMRPSGDILARKSGVIHYEPGVLIDVLPKYVHTGDVDLKTGHLETHGSITVRGSLQKGFAVSAGREAIITGVVDGGSVYSRGSIEVAGGVNANDVSILSAAKDISITHTQNGRLQAGGNVKISGNAVHSTIAAQSICVEARLFGGMIKAEKSVVVNDVGSEEEIPTVISVAEPLDRPLECELSRFSVEAALEVAQRERGTGTEALKRREKLDPNARRRAKDAARRRKDAQNEKRRKLVPTAFVEIRGTAYPGTIIKIGPERIALQTKVSGVRYKYEPDHKAIRRYRL